MGTFESRTASNRLVSLLAGSLVCAGAIMICVLLLSGVRARIAFILPGSMLFMGITGILSRKSWLAKLYLLVWSGAIAVYLVESGIEVSQQLSARREVNLRLEYAAARGGSFDLRTQLEYLLALRRQGVTAYPAFPRGHLLRESSETAIQPVLRGADGYPLLPLGSISNVKTVYGNETGQYLVYQSDEHGFHNPPDIWSLPRLKIAAVGDSLTQGASVPSDRNMVATIRARIPETMNLGTGGNGPLSELATILEYLPKRRPEIVLWNYCQGNDLPEDLEREKRSAILMGYLKNPPTLQALEDRQREIDEKLRLYVEPLMRSTPPSPKAGLRLSNWLALNNLSILIHRLRHLPQEDFALFQTVLERARGAVSSWNGRLALVYLQCGSGSRPRSQRDREQVLRICSELSIPFLDLESRFAAEASHFQDYFYPYQAHYTERGYGRAGEIILEELSKQRLAAADKFGMRTRR